MPAIPANSSSLLLSTDYPQDKIVFMYSGSQLVPDATFSGSIVIPHGLSFRPLAKMQWSNTPDFAITNEHGDEQYFTNIFGTQSGQDYYLDSTDTDLIINLYNTSGVAKTLYYRVYCFAPSDISEDSLAISTSNVGDNFVISTDYNYMKLFHEGFLSPTDMSYTHNLGYIPRVLVWQQTGSLTNDYTYGTEATSSPYGIYVTDTQLISLNPSADKLHYRIYIDE